MTDEAMRHAIANLEQQLIAFERMGTRSTAERQERDDRVAQIRADIARSEGAKLI